MKLAQKIAVSYYRSKFKLLATISKKKAAEKAFDLFKTPQRRLKKKLPKIFSEAQKIQLTVEGNKVKGWRWNHPAERKVLIIHGYESSVINFDRYVRPFIRKGYEVLAFDAPAHGISSGKHITAPLYRNMIKIIHQQYGPVQSYLAHSFGGLAVSLALEEISHDETYRLALIAPATETTTAIDSFFSFLRLPDVIRPEFEKVIVKTGGVSSRWYSIKRAMRNIKAKVKWFHDDEDDVTPITDVINVQKENYSNIEFVITTGLGHRRIYRDNKVTKAIVDFL